MTRPRRRDPHRAGAAAQPQRSTRYRNIVNPFTPVRIFSDDQIESMHRAALGILERFGVRVLSERGRAVLAQAGATVDEASQMVRLDAGLVTQALASVPAEAQLVAGNPARSSSALSSPATASRALQRSSTRRVGSLRAGLSVGSGPLGS